jgi:hypothetical protein
MVVVLIHFSLLCFLSLPCVWHAGLANTYASYVATYEEYQGQRYEAASTIYGPHTLSAYLMLFENLGNALVNQNPVPTGALTRFVRSSAAAPLCVALLLTHRAPS